MFALSLCLLSSCFALPVWASALLVLSGSGLGLWGFLCASGGLLWAIIVYLRAWGVKSYVCAVALLLFSCLLLFSVCLCSSLFVCSFLFRLLSLSLVVLLSFVLVVVWFSWLLFPCGRKQKQKQGAGCVLSLCLGLSGFNMRILLKYNCCSLLLLFAFSVGLSGLLARSGY